MKATIEEASVSEAEIKFSGAIIILGGTLMLIEVLRITLGLVVIELTDKRIDSISLLISTSCWICFIIGIPTLNNLRVLAKWPKLIYLPMAGLLSYTIGCLLIYFSVYILAFIPIGVLLTSVGMVSVGMATLRAEVWIGWRRFTPLMTGLYPFLFMFPHVAIQGVPNYYFNYAWGITWVLLGWAIFSKPK